MQKYRGTVIRGEGSGRRLGFPTANIVLTDSGLSGIYAGEAEVDGKTYAAALYANTRRGILEAHILDFSGDLYDQTLFIRILKKVRDDLPFEAFADEEALRRAIGKDVEEVRAYFGPEGGR